MNPELVHESNDCCGESPRWDPRRQCLWWIDNERVTVHCHTPATGETSTFHLPRAVSSLALADAGGAPIAALEDGLHQLGDDGSVLERLLPLASGAPECVFNDSGVDPRGRLWIGSGSDTVTGQGRLWLVAPGAPSATSVLDGLSLPNGIGFSPDARFMYLVDSFAPAVYRIPYDLGTGALGPLEPFCTPSRDEGVPDGLAVDIDGGVWVAFWEGGCVRRYAPDGTLDALVEFPVRLLAGCAFGGPERSELYVTSAWYDLSEEARADQPLAGALFRVATGTQGVPIGRIPAGAWSANG